MHENNERLAQGVLKKGANGSGTPAGNKQLKIEARVFEIQRS